MGKASVSHQAPVSTGAAGANENNGSHQDHSPSFSTSAPPPAVLQAASREIFQGLFQDLGKQAMAMEAIMRLICGKVDKLETWMTEISFGMTEMDLKLRNIAHNIEGTAANVDDDATNVYRWAAPPPDNPAPSLATVKLKVGGGANKKKNVKMTGMVASIFDTSGAPADERDNVTLSGHKKMTSVANVVKKTHKKHHGHQNEHDRVVSQSHDDESHDDERAKTVSSDASPVTPVVVEGSVVMTPSKDQSQTKTATLDTTPSGMEIPIASSSVGDLASNHGLDQQHDSERSISDSGTDRSGNDTGGAETVDDVVRVEQESSPAIADSLAEATHRPTTTEMQREVVASVAEPPQDTPMEYHQEQDSVVTEAEAAIVLPVETALPQHVELAEPITVVVETTLASETKPVAASMQPPAPSKASTSSYLPLSPQQGSTETHIVIPRGEPVTKSEHSTPTQSLVTTTESAPVASHLQELVAPVVATAVTPPTPNSRKASSPSVRDTRKTPTRRKSSKFASSKAQPPPATSSAPTAATVDAPEESTAVVSSVASSDLRSDPPAAAIKEHEVPQAPKDKDNDKSGNDSSDDGDDGDSSSDSQDSSSGNENQEAEIEDATIASRKQSKAAGASTMTHTIAALKKLKKANMLTPEEEEELKQRTQEKWFKLKGHMKEKKKKDVTNILLKRKKNVFTVSARIELLEEKSKETYAMIKQLNNDLKTKVDLSANDVLRRQVHDINLSLQALDHKVTYGSSPAMEKAAQLSKDLEQVRTSFSQQLESVNDEIIATRHKMGSMSDEHRDQLEFLNHAFEKRVASLMEENDTKFRNLLDHAAALEGIKRSLRKKADLKLLKELEARLLDHDADGEDCLVRCLSCHKEVTDSANADTEAPQEVDESDRQYMKKVNPGPSAGKIYRSNVPFSAQLLGAHESIPEDTTAPAAGNSYFSDRPATGSAQLSVTPKASARRESTTGVAPISLIQVKASRAAMSPDRPISAPAAALKKKAPYLKSKTMSGAPK
ncbi:hypothetical protein FI667_g11344, partial [Globisporangium splendens]